MCVKEKPKLKYFLILVYKLFKCEIKYMYKKVALYTHFYFIVLIFKFNQSRKIGKIKPFTVYRLTVFYGIKCMDYNVSLAVFKYGFIIV